MKNSNRGVLLTGATGLLGRYILRDLLHAGGQVAVLVRDSRTARAADRIGELVDFWSLTLGRRLPEPVVLCGDIRTTGLGLSAADRHWLATDCDAVVHAAASLDFRATSQGEPWTTNVEGTRHLLKLCRQLGLANFHHVSTAYVSGETSGPVLEDDERPDRVFRNAYEQSKWEAERLVRQQVGIQATIYRPSVIVGDSSTGYTSSYHGIYRFLRFADRLAESVPQIAGQSGVRRRLDIRLPMTGEETRNLVPVDWVAQAIVRMMNRPELHGRTYHLVSSLPVSVRLLKEVAEDVAKVEGVRFAGPSPFGDASALEELFINNIEEFWPYLESDPLFDRRNLFNALPDLPPVAIDRPLLARLIDFAVCDRWGRGRRTLPAARIAANPIDCRHYVEHVFREAAQKSPLARRAGLHVAVALDVRGPAGGQWTCGWVDGDLAFVRRGLEATADVVYRTDPATFDEVVRGRQSPQEAFFARRIEIEGDVEKALKLGVLFEHFLAEGPALLTNRTEERDAIADAV